jgi:preprotein translocase SecE subunit
MADKPAAKKRRIVKNPETFRERASKAASESDKPKRTRRLRSASSRVAGPVFRPVGRAGSKVFGLKPFRLLRKPLRLIGKVLVPPYLRNSWRELRQVHWPSRPDSFRLTFAVIIFAFIFGAVVAVVDYGLDRVFRDVLLK